MGTTRKTYEVFGYRVFTVTKFHEDNFDVKELDDTEEAEEYPEEQLSRLGTSDHSFGFNDKNIFSHNWEEEEE